MKNKCLYCYQLIDEDVEFHSKCSKEIFGTTIPPKILYSFDQMDVLAKNVVERSVAVPGVQAKLSMTLVKKTKDNTDDRLTVVGALGGNYIFKPPSERFYQMPENEHLTMRIAEAFGIKVVQSSLIRLQSGELSYITKRIDRKDNADKIHMIDMFQIIEAYDKYKSSYEKIGKAISNYSSNPLLDKSFFFDLILFSFITGNNDMHLKNFSMIETELGWVLSPAYDLLNVAIILPEDTEELALTLDGKKKKFRKAHFEQFGKELGLNSKQIKNAFERMIRNKPKAFKWIEASFLSEELKEGYKMVMESNYQKLGL